MCDLCIGPLFCGEGGSWCLFLFSNHLAEKGRTGFFGAVVVCVPYVSGTRGAVGWSSICDFDISWSYSLL